MATVNYPSDFTPADPAPFSPADPTLFLGLDPLLVLLLIVIALLLAGGGGWLGGGMARRRYAEDDPAEDLHGALLRVLEDAMKASTHELPARAQAVHDAFDRVIGPVLKLGAALNGPLKRLDEALVGDDRSSAKPPEAAPGKASRDGGGHGRGGHGAGSCGCGGVATAVSPSVIVVNPYPQRPAPARDCGCPPAAPCQCERPGSAAEPARAEVKAEKKTLSVAARNDQLRAAVTTLYDHWSNRPDRIAELRAARRALSRRPARPTHEIGRH